MSFLIEWWISWFIRVVSQCSYHHISNCISTGLWQHNNQWPLYWKITILTETTIIYVLTPYQCVCVMVKCIWYMNIWSFCVYLCYCITLLHNCMLDIQLVNGPKIWHHASEQLSWPVIMNPFCVHMKCLCLAYIRWSQNIWVLINTKEMHCLKWHYIICVPYQWSY